MRPYLKTKQNKQPLTKRLVAQGADPEFKPQTQKKKKKKKGRFFYSLGEVGPQMKKQAVPINFMNDWNYLTTHICRGKQTPSPTFPQTYGGRVGIKYQESGRGIKEEPNTGNARMRKEEWSSQKCSHQ
jgi:hypothetical protein